MTEIGDLITEADANAIAANDQAALDLAIEAEGFETTTENLKNAAATEAAEALGYSNDIQVLAESITAKHAEATDAAAAIAAALESASAVSDDVASLEAIKTTIETQKGICETAVYQGGVDAAEIVYPLYPQFSGRVETIAAAAQQAESAANSASVKLTDA